MKLVSLKMLRESGKKKLFVIPFLFTFANAFFGFLAVIKTFDYEFVTAAYCIIIAAIMDIFDGRLARAFDSSSYVGMELDSLSDAISFCFAPAALIYCWRLDGAGWLGILVPALYLLAGLLRLAKFNESSAKGVTSFFVGIPTTAAAFFMAQLVINSHWLSGSMFRFLVHPTGLLIVVAILAVLMVSPVHFPSFKKFKPSPVFAVIVLLGIGAFITFSIVRGMPFLLFGIAAYMASGILFELYALARRALA